MKHTNKILVAVPTMGSLHAILVSKLLLWTKQFEGEQLGFYFTFRVTPHDRARNEIVRFARSQKDITHILFIDSDTIPPDDALEKLVAHDLPFVTALTPILKKNGENGKHEVFDNCFLEPTRDEDGKIVITNIAQRNTGMQQVYRCGAACMLVKMEIFDKIPQPYFAFETDAEGLKHTRSEDIYFCDQLREAGYTLWADTSVYCQHQKEMII